MGPTSLAGGAVILHRWVQRYLSSPPPISYHSVHGLVGMKFLPYSFTCCLLGKLICDKTIRKQPSLCEISTLVMLQNSQGGEDNLVHGLNEIQSGSTVSIWVRPMIDAYLQQSDNLSSLPQFRIY